MQLSSFKVIDVFRDIKQMKWQWMEKLLASLICTCILNINCKQSIVWTPPVSVSLNKALTVASKQPLNNALRAFQFGGQTHC